MGKNIDFSHFNKFKQSYWEHLFFKVKWGLYFILTGFFSIIHDFFPLLWSCKASENILKELKEHDFFK